MQTISKVLAALICGLVCGCETTNTSQQNPNHLSSAATFVHPFTTFSFPESVEEFRRVYIRKYDRQGKDVGVGYNSPTPIAATVFVYPGPKDFALLPSPKLENISNALLDHHFGACKDEIARNHMDGRLISESPCKIVQGKNQFEGKKAVYSISYKFGLSAQQSVSELYVFLIEPSVKFLATDRYFVKYRVTYPNSKKAEAESEVAEFMTELLWPKK